MAAIEGRTPLVPSLCSLVPCYPERRRWPRLVPGCSARNRASSPSRFVAPPPRYSPVVTCIPGARSHESRDGSDDGSVTLELEQPRIARGLGNGGTDALRLPVKRTDVAYRSFGARWLSLETIINEASLKCYKTQVEPFAIISMANSRDKLLILATTESFRSRV